MSYLEAFLLGCLPLTLYGAVCAVRRLRSRIGL
jgi:hypothetical protein